MVRDTVATKVGTRVTGLAAARPRLVMTLVLLLAFIAVQGTVAAVPDVAPEVTFVDTSGSGSVDDGP